MVCGPRLGALELGRFSRYGIWKGLRGTTQEANNARRGLSGELGLLDVGFMVLEFVICYVV